MRAVSRLPGPPITWGRLELVPRPPAIDRRKWRFLRDPRSMCSYIPEDKAIERFSGQTLRQMRLVHVLNGREVRSYADWFIRRS